MIAPCFCLPPRVFIYAAPIIFIICSVLQKVKRKTESFFVSRNFHFDGRKTPESVRISAETDTRGAGGKQTKNRPDFGRLFRMTLF